MNKSEFNALKKIPFYQRIQFAEKLRTKSRSQNGRLLSFLVKKCNLTLNKSIKISRAALSSEIDVTERSITNYYNQLESAGLIKVYRKKTASDMNEVNCIKLTSFFWHCLSRLFFDYKENVEFIISLIRETKEKREIDSNIRRKLIPNPRFSLFGGSETLSSTIKKKEDHYEDYYSQIESFTQFDRYTEIPF